MRSSLILVVALTLPAAAQAAEIRPKLFDDVTACRVIADSAARLQCYDRAVAQMATAEQNRDLVVVDRAQVRETRKTLFGLALPKLAIFDGKDDAKAEDVSQIESTLSAADVDSYGHWRFRLADGAKWTQTDDNVVARRPRAGDKVLIRRAALGSFKLSVTGQPAIKVRREN